VGSGCGPFCSIASIIFKEKKKKRKTENRQAEIEKADSIRQELRQLNTQINKRMELDGE